MTRGEGTNSPSAVVDNRITFDDSIGCCEASYANVNRTQPPVIEANLTKSQWEDFCSNVDKDMKPLGIIRPVLWRLGLVYAVLVVALYLCVTFLEITIFGSFLEEFLISLGIFLVLALLFVIKVRYGVIRAVQRRCRIESKQSFRDRIVLECRLPFCQFRGKMTSGWYIAVKEQASALALRQSHTSQDTSSTTRSPKRTSKTLTASHPSSRVHSGGRVPHTRPVSPFASQDFNDPGV